MQPRPQPKEARLPASCGAQHQRPLQHLAPTRRPAAPSAAASSSSGSAWLPGPESACLEHWLGLRRRRRGAKGSPPPTDTASTPPQHKSARAQRTRVHVETQPVEEKHNQLRTRPCRRTEGIARVSGLEGSYKLHCTSPGREQESRQRKHSASVWQRPADKRTLREIEAMPQFIGAWKQSPETSRPQAENTHVQAYRISRVIGVWKRSLEISRLQAEVTHVLKYNMLQLLRIWKRSGEISRLSERTTQTPLGMTKLVPGDWAQRKSGTGL